MGRWAARGSADTYVRTALRVCENLQKAAITHARRSLAGGPDFYGEEQVLASFAYHLCGLGLSEEEVDEAVGKLWGVAGIDITLSDMIMPIKGMRYGNHGYGESLSRPEASCYPAEACC